jgi:antitoxin component YwqK of YwqJK toxin-antitoxin module
MEDIMKTLLILLLLPLFSMSGQTVSQDTSYFRNGSVMQLYTYTDGVMTERLVYYATGELQLRQTFAPTTGLQIGAETLYFRNGKVQHRCHFVNGYAHGRASWFDESGKEIKTEVYVESMIVPVESYYKYFPDGKDVTAR